MTHLELKAQIEIELNHLEATVRRVEDLLTTIGIRPPDETQLVALATYLVNLYAGVERILKRISVSRGIPLPEGSNWHRALLAMYCAPTPTGLPRLIDGELEEALAGYLAFRHVFVHGYALDLRWEKVEPGARGCRRVLDLFRSALSGFLDSTGTSSSP